MKTIRSLVLAQDFPPIPGGVSVFAENLFKNWKGPAVILVPEACAADTASFPSNITIKPISLDLNRNNWRPFAGRQVCLYRAGRKILRRERIDVVHCTHIASGPAALLLKWGHGVPYVLYTYGSDITAQPGFPRKPLARAIVRNAAQVVTMSRFTRDAVAALGIDAGRVCFLRGVDRDRFTRRGNPTATAAKYGVKGRPILLTVARLVEHKGIDTVIRALPRLITTYPDLIYLVIGEGAYRGMLENLVSRLGLKKHVRLIGHVPHNKLQDETEAFYSLCDLFVLASRNIEGKEAEGFGLVFLEAALSKKAVVGGNSGGIADAVLDGVTGKLVNPENPDAVADGILSLLKDRKTARDMGENGCRRALAHFDWKANVSHWECELVERMAAK